MAIIEPGLSPGSSGPARRRLRLPRPPAGPVLSRTLRDPVQPAVEPLIAAFRAAHPQARRPDLDVLRRAYAVAERMHRGQRRKSGNPYVTHPLAVALILADLGLDVTCLVAALLHDTVEDTAYTLGEVRADFGDEVAMLVDGVTKLDGERWGKDRAEAETFRKIVLAAAADLRVLIIKLADRLHNLRTLGFQPPHKRERIARATLELLVPFAERLGIHVLKRDMDDLAFATLDPEAHAATARAVRRALARAGPALAPVASLLGDALAEHRVSAEVQIRPRHLHSVHRGREGDLTGLRPSDVTRLLVLVDGPPQDCYIALGAVHSSLHPITGRVKDHIALPRFNLYRSLHTVLIGPEGDFLDVIVRNRQMHEVAEYGIIAHIRQAQDGQAGEAVAGRLDLGWLAGLLSWQSDAPSAEFLDGLRADLAGGNIACFTPEGVVVPLPRQATALDYAYALGPEIGAHSIGALINGRLVPLSAEVRVGNVVEILTDPEATPCPGWLEFARTPQARVHIQRHLDGLRADETAGLGRERLRAALAERGVDLLAAETSGDSLSVARTLGHSCPEELYRAVGGGTRPLPEVLARFTAAGRRPSPG